MVGGEGGALQGQMAKVLVLRLTSWPPVLQHKQDFTIQKLSNVGIVGSAQRWAKLL